MSRELRVYLGELDSEFITLAITEEQYKKLIETGKVNFDDGGILFTEIIMTYQGLPPLVITKQL